MHSVRVEGLEPPCLAALDPKSSVSTNFTTPALDVNGSAKIDSRFHISKIFFIVPGSAGIVKWLPGPNNKL